jgi:hypothetical protein
MTLTHCASWIRRSIKLLVQLSKFVCVRDSLRWSRSSKAESNGSDFLSSASPEKSLGVHAYMPCDGGRVQTLSLLDAPLPRALCPVPRASHVGCHVTVLLISDYVSPTLSSLLIWMVLRTCVGFRGSWVRRIRPPDFIL